MTTTKTRTKPPAVTETAQPPARKVWRPLGARVILKPTEPGVKTEDGSVLLASGIALPGTVRRPATTGVVIACGPDCAIAVPEDLVLFVSYSGATVKLGNAGDEFLVLDEADILAVLRGEDEDLAGLPTASLPVRRGGLPQKRGGVRVAPAYRS